MSTAVGAKAGPLALDNSYAHLPDDFYARVSPTPVRQPQLIRLNRTLAELLGLDPELLASPEGIEILAGNRVPEGSQPLAMAYAGHQFGQWVPSLGDGRAVLLGEVIDREGLCHDIQLKGAGATPFSRSGDGRAALGPVLREYVVSEAMAALGIPTTRALAMVATGEPVARDRVEPGAILTRVATGHVRVGTFEYFSRRGKDEAVRTLADFVIARHYPDAADATHPYRQLLDEVIRRQAELIARWMLVGFIHGVMNTDNTSVAGETIDYGPCAFMDTYNPAMVYSSIDHGGRYAFNQQPPIGHWNLARFAETLLPLLGENEHEAIACAHDALDTYPGQFSASYQVGLRRKLGLAEAQDGDLELAENLLQCMAEERADFTLTFRGLSDMDGDSMASDGDVRELFSRPEAFDAWVRNWRVRIAAEGRDAFERQKDMRSVNPRFIPRNHRVQQAIDAAVDEQDLQPLEDLLAVLARPYDDSPEWAAYAQPPQPHEVVRQTFCGT